MSDDIQDLGGGADADINDAVNFDADESAAQQEIENEARSQGWFPKEQWKGRESDWVDAETFVRRGREILPIVRKALQDERKKNQNLEAQLQAHGATIAEMREYFLKIEQTATKNAMANLKAQKRAALEAGDAVTAEDIQEQMDQLKDSQSAVPTIKAPVVKDPEELPEVKAWRKENPWYTDENPELVDAANGHAFALKARNPNASPEEILKKVSAHVQKQYPQYFQAPSGMFEGTGSQGGSSQRREARSTGKGFNSLPEEAKAQFQRFYDSGFYLKKGSRTEKLDKKDAQAEYYANYQE